MKLNNSKILLSITALSFVSLNAQTLLQDAFIDGGRTDGADALDTNWYAITNGTSLSVVSDSTTGPNEGGSDNALQLDTTAGSFKNIGGAFSGVSLEIGQTLSLSVDIRFSSAPTASDGGVRLGLFTQGGSLISADNTGSSQQNPTVSNDDGYFIRFATDGNHGANSGIYVEDGDGSHNVLLTGGDTTKLSTGTITTPAALGTSSHSVLFEISRSSASAVDLTFSVDGIVVSSVTDTTSLFTTFDHAVLGLGSVTQDVRFDNINVAVIPEPSAFAALGAVALLAFGLKRRALRRNRS